MQIFKETTKRSKSGNSTGKRLTNFDVGKSDKDETKDSVKVYEKRCELLQFLHSQN